jgi:hypothetical protein
MGFAMDRWTNLGLQRYDLAKNPRNLRCGVEHFQAPAGLPPTAKEWPTGRGYPESSLAPVCVGKGWGERVARHREFIPYPNLSPARRGAFRTASE